MYGFDPIDSELGVSIVIKESRMERSFGSGPGLRSRKNEARIATEAINLHLSKSDTPQLALRTRPVLSCTPQIGTEHRVSLGLEILWPLGPLAVGRHLKRAFTAD